MFTPTQQQTLLQLAKDSIAYGLQHHIPIPVKPTDFEPVLQQKRASFVTLNIHQQLRGCIGSLQAIRPLCEDIAENAFAAAFRDPRFSPVQALEFELLQYHISILSTPESMSVSSRTDLLSQLRPGMDGLILVDGAYRSTFLPSVWEQLPQADHFLDHLLQKAGLPAGYWSDSIQFSRYTVVSVQ